MLRSPAGGRPGGGRLRRDPPQADHPPESLLAPCAEKLREKIRKGRFFATPRPPMGPRANPSRCVQGRGTAGACVTQRSAAHPSRGQGVRMRRRGSVWRVRHAHTARRCAEDIARAFSLKEQASHFAEQKNFGLSRGRAASFFMRARGRRGARARTFPVCAPAPAAPAAPQGACGALRAPCGRPHDR